MILEDELLRVAFKLLQSCEERGWILVLPKFEEDLVRDDRSRVTVHEEAVPDKSVSE